MDAAQAKVILDKVVGQIFGYDNPLSLEQAMQKFAFDVRLPQQVYDSMDRSVTWAQSINPTKFLKMQNARAHETGIRPPKPMNTIDDILASWNEINYTTTERVLESINVADSDSVHQSQNVFRSQDIGNCKNVIFCDSLRNCEFMVASQRCGGGNTFGIRIDDSSDVSNSFAISWCSKITNCLFLHDCADMQDSMFCTNMKGGRFCIANMQYDEAEYRRLRDVVVRWVLTG